MRIKIWDLYLRIFHWALGIAVLTCFVALEINEMDLHMNAGLTVLGLLIFRLLWGIFGSNTARFTYFVPSPSSLLRYLKTGTQKRIGHSPLGALSVIAVLGVLIFQVSTGVFTGDDESFIEAPLRKLISSETMDRLTYWHKTNGDIIQILIGVHILAIVFYRVFQGKKLTKAMITGKKEAEAAEADELSGDSFIKAAIATSIATAISVYIAYY